jgi:hypothetical protein
MTSEAAVVTPTLTQHITAEATRAVATEFLLDHLGNQLVAGEPLLMVSAVRAVWIVPVQLVYIHTGTIGSVGVVAVDEETTQVVAWTPIPHMKAMSRQLREAQNPDIDHQFQAYMTPPRQAEDS